MTDDQFTADARAYIDSILAINRHHGYTAEVDPVDYEQAVRDAARPARRVAVARERNPA